HANPRTQLHRNAGWSIRCHVYRPLDALILESMLRDDCIATRIKLKIRLTIRNEAAAVVAVRAIDFLTVVRVADDCALGLEHLEIGAPNFKSRPHRATGFVLNGDAQFNCSKCCGGENQKQTHSQDMAYKAFRLHTEEV